MAPLWLEGGLIKFGSFLTMPPSLLTFLSWEGALECDLGGKQLSLLFFCSTYMAIEVVFFCILTDVGIELLLIASKSAGYWLLVPMGCLSFMSSIKGPRTLLCDTVFVFEYIELFIAILEDSRKRTIASFWHKSWSLNSSITIMSLDLSDSWDPSSRFPSLITTRDSPSRRLIRFDAASVLDWSLCFYGPSGIVRCFPPMFKFMNL